MIVRQNPDALGRQNRPQPLDSLLDERRFAEEIQNLLCACAPAARPETRAASTSQNQAVVILFRHVLLNVNAAHQPERPLPARLGEKVLSQVDEVLGCEIHEVFRGRVVTPENHERFSDNILARHETPVA